MYCYPEGTCLKVCDEYGLYRSIEMPGKIASAYLNESGGLAVLTNGQRFILEVIDGEVYPRPC